MNPLHLNQRNTGSLVSLGIRTNQNQKNQCLGVATIALIISVSSTTGKKVLAIPAFAHPLTTTTSPA
jgi:hypothetical protein